MKRILIVEDEMVQVFLLRTQLKNLGHRSADVAADGEATQGSLC
jgi:CheY-like chemotaxis protein